MFIINDPGHWQTFLKRPDNIGLSIEDASKKYLLESTRYHQLLQEIYQQQQQTVNSAVASGASKIPDTNNGSSNCIEFVNNTTDGLYSYIEFESSAPTNFTITWGDGQTTTDVVDGVYSLEHEYPDADTEYSCRLCFDDATLITHLDFLGDD